MPVAFISVLSQVPITHGSSDCVVTLSELPLTLWDLRAEGSSLWGQGAGWEEKGPTPSLGPLVQTIPPIVWFAELAGSDATDPRLSWLVRDAVQS
jgi:hypothetical protein